MSAVITTAKTVLSIVGFLRKEVEEHHQEKDRLFFNAILESYRDGIYSSEEFQRQIEDKIYSSIESRSAFIKLLSFSYRSLLDLVDDRVLPALARLTAEYMEQLTSGNVAHIKAPVDPFFRGLCRLLSDLTGDELDELQKLCGHLLKMPDDIAFLYLDYNPGKIEFYDDKGIPNTGLWIHLIHAGGGTEKAHIGEFMHTERLAHLLVTNGFNQKPINSLPSSSYGRILVWLDGGAAKHIARIVLPGPSK